MYNKLLSLHIACGLLLATSMVFGMEKESPNPERQQLYLVVKYADSNHNDIWNFFDQNGDTAPMIGDIKYFDHNYTLKYNKVEQILFSNQTNVENIQLTDLKLSDTQIDIAQRIIEANTSKAYVNINKTLFFLSKLESIPYTRERSDSNNDPDDFLTLPDTVKKDGKKTSSRLSNYCIVGGVVISIGALIAAYLLACPDKRAQLLESLKNFLPINSIPLSGYRA
jgi:hypothetical protein